MELTSCPYCNAALPGGQLPLANGKACCPRCGEPLPAQMVTAIPAAPSSPVALPPAAGWSNRKIALSVLGIMLVMAAIGLTLALSTVGWRRSNDYRAKKDQATPLALPAPGEFAGLGYLPPDVNVVAAVHVADLFNDAAGKKLLEAPRPPLLDMLLGAVEKWAKLPPAQLDHVVVGTAIRDKVPQLTIVARTRRPYEPAALTQALRPAQPTLQRGKSLYRFALTPGEGMLWCPDPYTLILLLRLDGLKMDDLEAIPLAPRTGAEAAPRPAVQKILAERGREQSLLWAAGSWEDSSLVKEALSFAHLPERDVQFASNLKAFSIRLYSKEGLALVGDFQTGNGNTTRLLAKQLEGLKTGNLKSVKVVTDPAAEWVTMQIQGEVQAVREVMGQWGKAKAKD